MRNPRLYVRSDLAASALCARFIGDAVGGVLASDVQAGPLVIEETSKFNPTSPDPPFELRGTLISTATLDRYGTTRTGAPYVNRQAAFLFERASSGAWVFVRKLVVTSRS